MVFGDFRVDKLAAMPFEPFECPFLIAAHQPRIARDIGGQDGSQPPIDPLSLPGVHHSIRTGVEAVGRAACGPNASA
jgi:hypothetical protein